MKYGVDVLARGSGTGRATKRGLRILIVTACLLLLLCSCGPRKILKQPIPEQDARQALRLMVEGDRMLREGKDHLAMAHFLDASLKNPYHEVIFNKLAVSYARLRMFEQAGRAVDRSLGLDWAYAFAHNTKGIVKLAESDPKGAAKSFGRAIERRDDVGNFYLNLGYAQVQMGRFDNARESYRRALEVQPNLLEDETGIVLTTVATPSNMSVSERYFQMARVFAELGELQFCLRYLNQAVTMGFSDFKKILNEEAFKKFAEEPEYQDFLSRFGISG